MSKNLKLAARKRIVGLFNRATLEKLSQQSRPWLSDTATLKQAVIIGWPLDEIEDEIAAILQTANSPNLSLPEKE